MSSASGEARPAVQAKKGPGIRQFLLGGLLPIIAFTVIEEKFGVVAGLIAGMFFGVGEIFYEKFSLGKVDPVTWGGNGLLLVLGGVSLVTQEGVWFKLQPSLLEAAFAGLLWGSLWTGRKDRGSLFRSMTRKQGQWEMFPEVIRPVMSEAFRGLTFRSGVFLVLHAVLAAWAALHWSTRAWAILKGVGFTVTFMVYLVVETLLLRYRITKSKAKFQPPNLPE